MKKLIAFVLLFGAKSVSGQAIVSDPVNEAQTAINGSSQNSRLDEMAGHQSAIQKAQLAAVTNLAFINDVQKKIYNGLTQVSSVLTNAQDIIWCGTLMKQIVDYQSKIATYAQGNPLLVAFAEQSEYNFLTRGYNLITYISTTVIRSGTDMLMDAGDRARLLQHVKDELQIMVGISYTASRAVWMAKQIGFVKSLNPWRNYVNLDKQSFQQVLADVKKF